MYISDYLFVIIYIFSFPAYFDVKDTRLPAFYPDSTPFLTYFYPFYIGIVDVNILCSL